MSHNNSTAGTSNYPDIFKTRCSLRSRAQSTPVKKKQHVSSRKQVQLSPSVKETPGDPEFTSKHLSSIPSVIDWKRSIDRDFLAEATKKKPEGGEWRYYHPFASFLTSISRYIFDRIPSREEATKLVEFVPNGNKHMTHHPGGMNTHSEFAPDVIGVLGPRERYRKPEKKKAADSIRNVTEPSYWSIPYQMVRTAIEMKNEKTDGIHQAISYVPFIFEASPHISGMYVLAARPQYYQLAWVDATGATASQYFSWDNLEPLAQYLYSLYVPPARHYLDPTLEFVSRTGDASDLFKKRKIDEVEPPVEWNVTVGNRKYEKCALRIWQYGQGRRTTLFQHTSAEGQKTMIKDAYRDEGRRFKEKDLVKQIHNEGIVPGVVRILDAVDVKAGPLDSDPLLTTAGGMTAAAHVVHRTKTRLVMGSSGDRLHKAKTVGDLVKAIYDVVEVHRTLVLERKVLHRDMSRNNILLYPQHHPLAEPPSNNGYVAPTQPLRFIDEVIQGVNDPGSALISQDRARCLLIDFDNSCPALKKTKPNETPKSNSAELGASASSVTQASQELGERTGTARFIARSVAQGRTLPAEEPHDTFYEMPILPDKAKKLYIQAYGEEMYKKFCDAEATFHGSTPRQGTSDVEGIAPFIHRPSHDVESVFWTFLLTLIAALPSGELLEESDMHPRVKEIAIFLYGHTIKSRAGGPYVDERAGILDWPVFSFEHAVHPKLRKRGLGKLLQRLALQVRPEYALLETAPPVEHLHEAFRRILLEYIVDHEEDCNIELNTERQRDIASAASNDKKRQREDVVDISSNKRSRHGEVVGSRFQSEYQLRRSTSVSTNAE